MKKSFKFFVFTMIMSLFILSGCASGKASGGDVLLKSDSSIKTGVLENGMKYYVKNNKGEKNRISLRLVVKVGSVQEEENERGFAHFVEHMAFNGTENFTKSQIVDYFETIGMNFGNELNAYTSFEETVYKLEIPADNPEILKTAMLILHDWASAQNFNEEEVEKEKGVIVEEWRLSELGLNGRISKQIIPFLLGGSVYENRLPIGLPEVIKNLTREEVSAFYKKWYRPELMSVIVVGDTDVSVLEKSVKDAMSVIPPSNEKISTMFNRVPCSEEKDILIIKDSEQVYPIINIFDHTENDNIYITEADFKNGMCKYFASSIFNQRASEITNTVDAPWLAVGVGENAYSNHDLFPYLGVVPKEGMFETSLKKLFDEYERFIAFGITESELERVKKEVAANNAKYRANKNHEKGSDVADRIIRQIILGSVNQSVEDYCEVYMRLLSQITAEDVNTYARSAFKNRGNRFFLIAPENYPCPSENEIMELWNNYHNDEIAVYSDDSITELMKKPSEKGSIVSSKKLKDIDAKEYVLSNGIRIILKKTDYEADKIIMQAASKGGSFYVSDEDFPSSNLACNYSVYSGLNGVTYNQLVKFVSDKNIDLSFSINDSNETVTGSSNIKNIEYLLQLTNLFFTGRQYNDDAWKMLMDSETVFAQAHGAKPEDHFRDKVNEILFGKGDLRHAPFDMDYLNKMNPESAKKVMEERFANPRDFTFVFVGDIKDEKGIVDLCCSYLGTLVTTDVFEESKYLYWDFPNGITSEVVQKGQDPQGKVYIAFGGELPPEASMEEGFKEAFIADNLTSLLDIRLREVIREDKGGSYGVSVNYTFDGYPERFYRFSINFGCEPEREKELTDAVINTVKDIQKNGVSSENVTKLKETYRRSQEYTNRTNRWWLNRINAIEVFTYQPSWCVNEIEKLASWITSENITDAARKYLDTEKYVSVFLKPEE